MQINALGEGNLPVSAREIAASLLESKGEMPNSPSSCCHSFGVPSLSCADLSASSCDSPVAEGLIQSLVFAYTHTHSTRILQAPLMIPSVPLPCLVTGWSVHGKLDGRTMCLWISQGQGQQPSQPVSHCDVSRPFFFHVTNYWDFWLQQPISLPLIHQFSDN